MRITFTPLSRADFPLLASWLALPHVRAWWLSPEPTVAAVEADYGGVVDGSDPMRAYVIQLDVRPRLTNPARVAAPGTHARGDVGRRRGPLRSPPSALRSHAPDSAAPALRADDAILRTGPRPAGLIQAFRHADEPDVVRMLGMPDAAGIDYLIGPAELRGRGIGSAAIHAFTRLVFGFYPEVTGIVAAPLARNRASCRALEKAGFRHLGLRDLDSPDPSDAGVNSVYHLPRPS